MHLAAARVQIWAWMAELESGSDRSDPGSADSNPIWPMLPSMDLGDLQERMVGDKGDGRITLVASHMIWLYIVALVEAGCVWEEHNKAEPWRTLVLVCSWWGGQFS